MAHPELRVLGAGDQLQELARPPSEPGRHPVDPAEVQLLELEEQVVDGVDDSADARVTPSAHHRIPVTFVVCNNAQYQILKHCGHVMNLPHMAAGQYLAMDLVQPEVDFVSLARSLGVEAYRVSDPDELAERVRDSLAGDRPQLIDVPITR